MDNEVTLGTEYLEEELKEYKKFFDDTPVAFLRTDIRTGKFLMANNYCATLFGYHTLEELMEFERMVNLCSKEDRQKMLSRIKKEGTIEGYELKLKRKDGATIWVSFWAHINCGGKCIEGTMIDITAQKEAEFELEILKNKQLIKMRGISEKLEDMVSSYAM